MNTDTINKISKMVHLLEKFRVLDEEDQAWITQLLECGKGALSTIRLIDLLENKCLTYQEIADELGCHLETVKQRIDALTKGGFKINSYGSRYSIPRNGRRRKKLEKKKDMSTALTK